MTKTVHTQFKVNTVTEILYMGCFRLLKLKQWQSQCTPLNSHPFPLLIAHAPWNMCWWKEMALQSECDIISCHIFHKLTVSYLSVPLVCGGNKLGDKPL